MQSRIRFHLDENINPEIASGLRRHGINATTAREVGLLGAEDADQLSHAKRHGRVLVTHDRDFLVLHAKDQNHSGICYCRPKNGSVGAVVRKLVLLWGNAAADDMCGSLTYL